MSDTPHTATTGGFDTPLQRRGTCSIKWERYDRDVLPLWVADMDFAAPPPVLDALRRRLDHGVLGYGMVSDSLSSAICDYHAEHHGWDVRPEWLLFLPGAVTGLGLACKAFAGPGDEVMVITPAYPPFLTMPGQMDRRLVAVPSDCANGRWQLPMDALEDAVTERTRALLFCHPHNPLGRIWTEAEVQAVVEFCHRHRLVLCSDEIHSELLLDESRHIPAAVVDDAAGRTVTVTSPSKAYNLAGLGFAYAVIPDEDMRGRFCAAGAGLLEYDCPTLLGAVACEAAYREGREWLLALLAYLRGNRSLVERFVAERLPRVSMTHVQATYLAWLDARDTGAADPAAACLQAGVGLSDGADFGAPGFLRLNFACRRTVLEEALERVATALG